MYAVCMKGMSSFHAEARVDFPEGGSGPQRMLNAIEPGTVMPIHRHWAHLRLWFASGGILRNTCMRKHFIKNARIAKNLNE